MSEKYDDSEFCKVRKCVIYVPWVQTTVSKDAVYVFLRWTIVRTLNIIEQDLIEIYNLRFHLTHKTIITTLTHFLKDLPSLVNSKYRWQCSLFVKNDRNSHKVRRTQNSIRKIHTPQNNNNNNNKQTKNTHTQNNNPPTKQQQQQNLLWPYVLCKLAFLFLIYFFFWSQGCTCVFWIRKAYSVLDQVNPPPIPLFLVSFPLSLCRFRVHLTWCL